MGDKSSGPGPVTVLTQKGNYLGSRDAEPFGPRGVTQVKDLGGALGRTRTCDLEIRRLLLYPAELRGHVPAAGAGNA